jgi:hypothetical protein
MRMSPIALCMMLLVLLSCVAQTPIVAPAAAQTQTKAQPQSKEALYLKCRDTIFRKYGQPGVQYNFGPRYRVLPYTAGSWIDHCVASGGRVDWGASRDGLPRSRRL